MCRRIACAGCDVLKWSIVTAVNATHGVQLASRIYYYVCRTHTHLSHNRSIVWPELATNRRDTHDTQIASWEINRIPPLNMTASAHFRLHCPKQPKIIHRRRIDTDSANILLKDLTGGRFTFRRNAIVGMWGCKWNLHLRCGPGISSVQRKHYGALNYVCHTTQ